MNAQYEVDVAMTATTMAAAEAVAMAVVERHPAARIRIYRVRQRRPLLARRVLVDELRPDGAR